MSRSQETLPEGTVLAGRFRVIRVLGKGGMGAVYEIEHVLTKHRRALKLLHAELHEHPAIVERFLREASAAGRIGNPHIVEAFDAGTLDTGEPYVVLELLAGETLADRLEREKQMELGALVEIVAQACEGVAAAHAAGIVHRDLKPENIFLATAPAGAPAFVKILDFGISKFDANLTGGMALTAEGSALGTPLYMPPEQVRGQQDIDGRADVYSLGVILYECCAGVPPFVAESLPHLSVLIHEGLCTPLAERRPDLPPAFIAAVARAMAADREHRTRTAEELRAALLGTATSESDLLGATAIGPAAFPSVVPAMSMPPARVAARELNLTPAATTNTSPSHPAHKPPRPRVGVLVGVGAAVVAVAGALFLVRPSAAPPVPEPPALARAPELPAPAVPSVRAVPEVLPPSSTAREPPDPTRAPSVSPSPSPSASASLKGPPRPAPTASTRAEATGLAKDPF